MRFAGHSSTSPRRMRRVLGASEVSVFPLALGASAFGWTAGNGPTNETLDRFAELGGNCIVTNASDSSGRSELMVGNWLRHHERAHFVIVSTIAPRAGSERALPSQIELAVQQTLARLRSEWIDVLVLDLAAGTPMQPVLETMRSLLDEGKIRAFGATDFTTSMHAEAELIAATSTLPALSVGLYDWSLAHRVREPLLRSLASQGTSVLPTAPLAGGLLAIPARSRELGRVAKRAGFGGLATRKGHQLLTSIEELSQEFGVAPSAIALAWLLHKPRVAAPVVHAASPHGLAAAFEAVTVPFTRLALARLDQQSNGMARNS
ncbi:aldo/keto reductase [Humidisolicoccus flavus]|uniref:aldo/keto reductase n=1 Tax=Humidisolicoccus flavus TaxID=3111414 RepID=UPI00324597EA